MAKGVAPGRGARRAALAVFLFVVVATAIVFAWQRGADGEENLWFNRYWWLVALAPLVGIGLSAFTKRTDPYVVGSKVLRHDGGAILSHWSHGLGTVVLLVTGIAMGCLFIPNILSDEATNAMMNVHFVGVIVFLFGTFYYMGNTIISPKRLREHLPDKNVVDYTKRHYGLMLGIKKFTMPPEEKYLESERAAYIMAVVVTGVIILSGIVKSLAHIVNISDGVMNVFTFAHDVCALLMVLFIIPHIFFAVFAPGSFPLFISMLTGFVSLKNAQEDHAGWLAELEEQGRGITADRERRASAERASEAPDESHPEKTSARTAPVDGVGV